MAFITLVTCFCLAIWFLRRPDQLRHPYVWVEEFKILNRWQASGFMKSALSPYEGYFLLPTSISVSLAARLNFAHLPTVEYMFSTFWFVATVLLILIPTSKVTLPWRACLAVLLALAPMTPEVYGVALLSFWWTTLWPLIALLWTKDHWVLRTAVLVIGGLSSPAGAALAVVYMTSFVVTRRRRDLYGAGVLFLCAVPQTIAHLASQRTTNTRIPAITIQFLRNLSFYDLTYFSKLSMRIIGVVGLVIMALLIVVVGDAVWIRRSRFTDDLVVMFAALVLLGIASSTNAPLIAQPILAGPRYYFLPFVTLSWVLTLIVLASRRSAARIGAIAMVALSVLTLSRGFVKHDDAVSWSSQLAQCRNATQPFSVPVHRSGKTSDMWHDMLFITPSTCRSLGY